MSYRWSTNTNVTSTGIKTHHGHKYFSENLVFLSYFRELSPNSWVVWLDKTRKGLDENFWNFHCISFLTSIIFWFFITSIKRIVSSYLVSILIILNHRLHIRNVCSNMYLFLLRIKILSGSWWVFHILISYKKEIGF